MSASLDCRGTLEVEVEGAKESDSDIVKKKKKKSQEEDFIGQKLSLSFIKVEISGWISVESGPRCEW